MSTQGACNPLKIGIGIAGILQPASIGGKKRDRSLQCLGNRVASARASQERTNMADDAQASDTGATEHAWDQPEARAALFDKVAPYLESSGWFRSAHTRSSVDRAGNPLPWYTYSSIAFLRPRVKRRFKVFEFGSGNSSLWWAGRTTHVTACEHEPKWADRMRPLLPQNVTYIHHPLEEDGAYARACADTGETFDVIVIDGRDRVNCVKRSIDSLKSDGVVIWDNSNRPRYQEGIDLLTARGFRNIAFRGHGPINGYETQTSIFYRPQNNLEI